MRKMFSEINSPAKKGNHSLDKFYYDIRELESWKICLTMMDRISASTSFDALWSRVVTSSGRATIQKLYFPTRVDGYEVMNYSVHGCSSALVHIHIKLY